MPNETTFRGRRAVSIENDHLRVTVLPGGGHIAEVYDKATGVNPLWTPPWTSIEPSQFDAARHRDYGDGVDARLLAGIAGHNLCLDIFGGPSDDEARAGLPVHGEASVVDYEVRGSGGALTARARLPLAGLDVERQLELRGRAVWIRETVRNTGGVDRPLGWTQHVTLGPPFLEKGRTEFRASVTRSRVFESVFGADDYLMAGADFDWPNAPRIGGGSADLRRFSSAPGVRRLYGSPDGPRPGGRILRGVLAVQPSGFRLCLASRGFPLDGHLGGKPEPPPRALEFADADARHGVRRLSFSGDAPRDGRAGPAVRHADLQMDTGGLGGQRRILVCRWGRRAHPGDTGVAGLTGRLQTPRTQAT